QFVETGEIRVRKEVVTEHRTIEVPVQREEVVIERHAPTGEPTSAPDLGPGEEFRIPVRKEQVIVEKRPVVKKEVTVGKRVVRDLEQVGGEVLKEEVRVERDGVVDIHDGGTGESST
ncbi:MAG: YsnF/AvaK domain-containing protein, partial [Singulisphaera sp.]|nr:YsnF/AvaK domain-containing protein [Singulisphaera sp.]